MQVLDVLHDTGGNARFLQPGGERVVFLLGGPFRQSAGLRPTPPGAPALPPSYRLIATQRSSPRAG